MLGDIEKVLFEEGYQQLIGFACTGSDAWAGPILIGSVALSPELFDEEAENYDAYLTNSLKDYKSLSEPEQIELTKHIAAVSWGWKVGGMGADIIKELGINETLRSAFRQALRAWEGFFPYPVALLEGETVLGAGVHLAFYDGVKDSYHLAAADVLAITYRRKIMQGHHTQWPQYGFDANVGFESPEHSQAYEEHGPCEIHRRDVEIETFRSPPGLFGLMPEADKKENTVNVGWRQPGFNRDGEKNMTATKWRVEDTK